jgi:uncharacterized protein YegP (UPF0339 family)
MIPEYKGNTYKAQSGQWAWVIYEDNDEVQRGAGYETEDDAEQGLFEAIAEWRGRLY